MCFSFGSWAKSLNTNSLVVISAIVTLLLITGGIISAIAWSKAYATSVLHSAIEILSFKFFGSAITYYGKFLIFK